MNEQLLCQNDRGYFDFTNFVTNFWNFCLTICVKSYTCFSTVNKTISLYIDKFIAVVIRPNAIKTNIHIRFLYH